MAPVPIRGNPRLALAAVALATFMTSLDNTVVNVALPSIQQDLRLSIGGLEWVASTYVLMFASLLLAGGRLTDLYGRKRLFLAGTAVFTAASLPVSSAMFTGEKERGRAVGAWSGLDALAVAIGPLTGGFISQHWQWGW